MSNFVTLAQYLRKINNFNTAFSIIAGLQLTAVYRLKLDEQIPKNKQKIYNELLELMNSRKSFKVKKIQEISPKFQNYRTALVESTPPLIPYLGLYLTDSTHIFTLKINIHI